MGVVRTPITPSVLSWALLRTQSTPEALAKRLGVKPGDVYSWLEGRKQPTLRQAQTAARALKIPFGYLFLAEPPEIRLPLPDFRSPRKVRRDVMSPELQDVLFDALRKSEWLSNWRKAQREPALSYVGSFSLSSSPEAAATDIRHELDLGQTPGLGLKDSSELFSLLVTKAERVGLVVLRTGKVFDNTRRKLSAEEFRGFAIADPFAPLVFVNTNDWQAARVFTLAHELAHIWLGESGISNPDPREPSSVSEREVEKWCNSVAAELLVPGSSLQALWRKTEAPCHQIRRMSRHFKVSSFVILLRSFEIGLINEDVRRDCWDALASEIGERRSKGSGGDFYASFFARNSLSFTRTVISAAIEGNITYRAAAQLLKTNLRTMDKAAKRLGLAD